MSPSPEVGMGAQDPPRPWLSEPEDPPPSTQGSTRRISSQDWSARAAGTRVPAHAHILRTSALTPPRPRARAHAALTRARTPRGHTHPRRAPRAQEGKGAGPQGLGTRAQLWAVSGAGSGAELAGPGAQGWGGSAPPPSAPSRPRPSRSLGSSCCSPRGSSRRARSHRL